MQIIPTVPSTPKPGGDENFKHQQHHADTEDRYLPPHRQTGEILAAQHQQQAGDGDTTEHAEARRVHFDVSEQQHEKHQYAHDRRRGQEIYEVFPTSCLPGRQAL